jgi:hypothetical protein
MAILYYSRSSYQQQCVLKVYKASLMYMTLLMGPQSFVNLSKILSKIHPISLMDIKDQFLSVSISSNPPLLRSAVPYFETLILHHTRIFSAYKKIGKTSNLTLLCSLVSANPSTYFF